jgi:hypothetical protein
VVCHNVSDKLGCATGEESLQNTALKTVTQISGQEKIHLN